MKKDSTLLEARRLHALGFAILWLRPRSKRPVGSGWTTGPRDSWDVLERSYRPGMNVGVRLGEPSKLKSGYLACIDVDIKEPRFRDVALKTARDFLDGKKAPLVLTGRGMGARHYYVTTPEPFPMVMIGRDPNPPLDPATGRKKFRWEVAYYSTGRQMVLPPSVHPDTGKNYRWKRPVTGQKLPVLAPGTVSSEGVDGKAGDTVTPTKREHVEDFTVEPVELAWLPVSDAVRDGILKGTGVTDRSAFLLPASSALFSAGLSRNEVLSVLTDPKNFIAACAFEHAQTTSRRRAALWLDRFTLKKVHTESEGRDVKTGKSVFAVAPLPPVPEDGGDDEDEEDEERHWKQDLDRTREGNVRVTLKNLELILENDPALRGVFVEDLFASRIAYAVKPPWNEKSGEYLTDEGLREARSFLNHQYGIDPGKDLVFEATSLVGHRVGVHPVRDWLESLKWDGKSRAETWLKKYCHALGEEPYLGEVSRKFLVAMVKRVFEPGCQWDYVVVLEGNQGAKKSSAARTLAGDRWFMDNIPDLRDKDAMLNLQGKWLVELSELADVKRADYSQVKAYLVRRVDVVRRPYGRIQVEIPRQSVFIGTINEGQYLKDPTGNRRYWPVKTHGKCDVAGLQAVRAQLFAEAMHLYREENERLYLSTEAEAQAKKAQDDRRIDDEASMMLDAFLHFRDSPEAKTFGFERFRTRDLMVGANAPWGIWNGKGWLMNTAAHVLTQLGYQRHKIGGQRYWVKTPEK